MSDQSTKGHEPLISPGLPLGIKKNDARDSILDFYTTDRSSYVSGDDNSVTAGGSKLRESVTRALAYEDQPDPYLESARTTTITKVSGSAMTSMATPPRRPPRPDSWVKNSSGNPWVDISLDGNSPDRRVESSKPQRRSKSAAPSSHFTANMSDITEIGESESMNLEKVQEAPPQPVGFWHSSLKKERRLALASWALMTLVLSAFILGILSLYWGAVITIDKDMSSITLYVVNFETQSDALVGSATTSITEGIVQDNNSSHLGFLTISPEMFNGDPLAVREAVWENKAWAAIIVNSNATQLLRQAIGLGNSSYDPNGAIQIVYNEAREQDLYFNHIYPMMQLVQTQILQNFGKRWTSEIMSNGAISKANMALVPQAINPGIGFSTYNLRPVLPHTATPALSIGLIYLIIISFFSFSFYLPIHKRLMKGSSHPQIKLWQFILWRWAAAIMAYLILSLAYSLVSVAFQFPFANSPGSHFTSEYAPSKFYDATFVVYWMINFLGMIALGLACENMAMFLGMPWMALWLIFWLVTNVTTAVNVIQLESSFYRWGYVWPLHNIVEASRTTLFDLHSNLGVNIGVLVVWATINTVLFPVSCLYMQRKTRKATRQQQQQQQQKQKQ